MSTMGKTYRFPVAAILLAALVLSCRKKQEEEPVYSSEEIVIDAASGSDTKGFLNGEGLKVNGTQFQIYDYLSGYNGTLTDGGGVQHTNGEEFKYFGNTLTYKGDATPWKWLFGDVATPTSYRWTRTGTHHFFGWLLKDATESGLETTTRLNSVSFNDAAKTLSIGNTALTIDSPQYDFLYSSVVSVNVANGIPEHVDLPMTHLLGAIGVTIQNTSDETVQVSSVEFVNFPNRGSAALAYDTENGVTVTPGEVTVSGNFWPNKLQSNITLTAGANAVFDAYTGAAVADNNPVYRMAWPIPYAKLTPTITGIDANGANVYSADSPLIRIRCKQGSGQWRDVNVRFPEESDGMSQAILAGKKTRMNILFANKQILLSFKVLPWEYEEYPMAFEEDAITATQLKFTAGTYAENIPSVTDAHGVEHDVIQLTAGSSAGPNVAKGTFYAFTPVNGVILASMSGDIEAFDLSLDSGTTNSGGNSSITINPRRDGGLITLTIKPKGNPPSGSKVFLHFSVLNGGRESDADTEINRDHYIVQIP